MNCCVNLDADISEYVEVDPTGRYGRYDEILGKGASKKVYKAFDEYEGIEVAWNQVKLHDFLRNPEDLEKLYREIHLLKTLNHENIMKFYASWVDTTNMTINFVTELFTAGTLRQYRLKHRRVNIRAVKHWCRQILKGLLYLHSLDPPVIHRDLKCDNIFVNGNQGEVKIGDLGLAAILRKSHAARCVGTPEFMAPEVYEEEYNELVDIYSFGMCVLEMVTFEYPYSECTHPAQIYKKVISGKRPEAFYKVKDPEVCQFVEKCLATVSLRLPASELLKDPFLQVDDHGYDFRPVNYYKDYDEAGLSLRQPRNGIHHNSSLGNEYFDYPCYDRKDDFDYHELESQMSEIHLFANHDYEHLEDDISIKGKRRDDDGIFLRLRIADKEGHIRNIYFPFDTETDTALSVAAEMVSELDITDQDVVKIADMIDGEIATLVPGWKKRVEGEERTCCSTSSAFCQTCGLSGYLQDTVSSNSQTAQNLHVFERPKHGCAPSIHGRFEEIAYQVEGQEQCDRQGAFEALPVLGDGIHYADIWGQRENLEFSESSKDIFCDKAHKVQHDQLPEEEERIINVVSQNENSAKICSINDLAECDTLDGHENEIRQELRWLKAKYRLHLMQMKDKKLGAKSKATLTNNSDDPDNTQSSFPSSQLEPKWGENRLLERSSSSRKQLDLLFGDKNYADIANRNILETGKSLITGAFVPYPLHRATSLPVDAIDV